MSIRMGKADLTAFLDREFPQTRGWFDIVDVTPDLVRVRRKIGEEHLRPGGTVSGPTIFGLADVAVYLATLSRIGPRALAVTTNCSIDFMRKPVADRDLLADTRLLKLGRSLAVGDVLIYSEGLENPVARASLTYAIPPAP